jgi:hypothetical protein
MEVSGFWRFAERLSPQSHRETEKTKTLARAHLDLFFPQMLFFSVTLCLCGERFSIPLSCRFDNFPGGVENNGDG